MFSRLRVSGSQAANQDLLARLCFDVFCRPFQAGPDAHVFVQNLGNASRECMYTPNGRLLDAYNASGPLSPELLQLYEAYDTRWCAATAGNTLVRARSEASSQPAMAAVDRSLLAARTCGRLGWTETDLLGSLDPYTADYVLYLLASGLLSRDDIDNFVPVRKFTNFHAILSKLKQGGRKVVAYNPKPDFYALCQRYGLQAFGKTSRAIAKLHDKHYFRELIEQLRPGTFRYPRLWSEAGSAPDVADLREVLAASRALQPDVPEARLLFIQQTNSAGGKGNFAVVAHHDGTFSIGHTTRQHVPLGEVAQFIGQLDSPVEVTPFIPLEASPSFGLVIASEGVACIGPFQQLLSSGFDYGGFKLNQRGSLAGYVPDVAEFLHEKLDDIMTVCLEIGEAQRQRGFRGYSGIDTMIYRDETGRLRVSYAEENQRYTATCMLQMLVQRRPLWLQHLGRGELSCMQDDHAPLSPEVVGQTGCFATRTADLLRSRGVPVVDEHTPFGVVLMARPCGLTRSIALGVVAPSDALRDAWHGSAIRALTAQFAVGRGATTPYAPVTGIPLL